jgi:enoyl-CoA hydratase
MCDILIAGSNALFGQPEITIGTIPGMGGSQRLARIIGKSRTMEMVLTGEPMKADEALQRGLVSKVVDKEKSLEEAIVMAKKIASKSIIISMACKDVVNEAYETTLSQGINYEKRVFWSTFATEDRKLGMGNFVNKIKDYKFTDN